MKIIVNYPLIHYSEQFTNWSKEWLRQKQEGCCPGVLVRESDERLSSPKWLFRVEGGGCVLHETYWSLTPTRTVWGELIITHSMRARARWSPLCAHTVFVPSLQYYRSLLHSALEHALHVYLHHQQIHNLNIIQWLMVCKRAVKLCLLKSYR